MILSMCFCKTKSTLAKFLSHNIPSCFLIIEIMKMKKRKNIKLFLWDFWEQEEETPFEMKSGLETLVLKLEFNWCNIGV